MAAVQYLTFPVDGTMKADLEDEHTATLITAENGRYRAKAVVSSAARGELLRDLLGNDSESALDLPFRQA